MIRIDTDIPIPDDARKPSNTRYPFAEMKIGHSFALDVPDGDDGKTFRLRVAGAAGAYAGRHAGYHFVTKLLMEDDKPVVRVWRVAWRQ